MQELGHHAYVTPVQEVFVSVIRELGHHAYVTQELEPRATVIRELGHHATVTQELETVALVMTELGHYAHVILVQGMYASVTQELETPAHVTIVLETNVLAISIHLVFATIDILKTPVIATQERVHVVVSLEVRWQVVFATQDAVAIWKKDSNSPVKIYKIKGENKWKDM